MHLFAKAARAWLGSVVACIAILATSVGGMQLLNGRTAGLLHTAADVSVAFGAIFALTAAIVYVPTFAALESLWRQRLTRTRSALLGAALGPIAYLAVAWRFRESGDPQTVLSWAVYWARHLPFLVLGALPFAAAGALFGVLWAKPMPNTEC